MSKTPQTPAVQALTVGELCQALAAHDDTPLRVNVPDEEHPMTSPTTGTLSPRPKWTRARGRAGSG